MRAGLSFLIHHSLLRTIVLAAVVINLVLSPIFGVALPLFAKQEFNSARDLGILMSGLGAGGLIGALGYGAIGSRLTQRTIVLSAILLLGLPLIGIATLPSLWIAWALVLLMGIGTGVVNPLVQTLIQKRTPPHLLGRVFGAFMAGSMVASPAGLLLGGSFISWIGLSSTVLVAAGTVFAVFLLCLGNRALRDLDDSAPDGDATPDVLDEIPARAA